MPDRTAYDLSHHVATCGEVGRLQMFSRYPVLPGDSFEIDIEGIIRMSPLRRPVVLDSKWLFAAFYVPLRHTYGDALVEWIKDGVDGTALTDTQKAITTTSTDYVHEIPKPYLCYKDDNSKIPKHIVQDYNEIWNWFFRDPQDTELAKTYLAVDECQNNFGYKIANIKTLTSSMRKQGRQIDAADYQVSAASDIVDIRDFHDKILRYRSETGREYFATRYNEILEWGWGSNPNTDTDPRPTILGTSEEWLSGYEVAGMDDATLGQVVGKSSGAFRLRVPRRFIPEHGTIYIVGALRYPPVYKNEQHRLDDVSKWNYHRLLAEPGFSDKVQREGWAMDDLFAGGGNTVIGEYPNLMHYRTHPNYVHPYFTERDVGYPYLDSEGNNLTNLWYTEEYGQEGRAIFQTELLAHWQFTGISKVLAIRPIAPPSAGLLLTGGF